VTEAAGWRDVVERLGMAPHPEGGWYVETWRSSSVDASGRAVASAILFLLAAGERSHWHRVDAAEIWQWSAGDAIELRISGPQPGRVEAHRLGGDVLAGDEPQVVVPPGAWQAARPLGAWTLVGCIVAPAFTFDGFELAPDGWEPAGSDRAPGDEPSA
jgi:predicted cupin superfamily sugar epimerase